MVPTEGGAEAHELRRLGYLTPYIWRRKLRADLNH